MTPDPIMKSWQQALIAAALIEGRPNPLPVYGADGLGGHETQDAILAFQASRTPPLPATGQFDDATRAALTPKDTPMPNILGTIWTGLLGNLLNWTLIQGYIRSALLGLGGSLVTQGVISGTQLNDAVGALLLILGIILSAVSNNTKKKAMDVVKAVDAHPAITVIPASDSPTDKPILRVSPQAASVGVASGNQRSA